VSNHQDKGFDIGAVSIVLGVVLVIVSVVWATSVNIASNDEKSGDNVMWVG